MADFLDMAVYQGLEWEALDGDLEALWKEFSGDRSSVDTALTTPATRSVQMLLDAQRNMLRTVARSGVEHREFWLITTTQAIAQARLRRAHLEEYARLSKELGSLPTQLASPEDQRLREQLIKRQRTENAKLQQQQRLERTLIRKSTERSERYRGIMSLIFSFFALACAWLAYAFFRQVETDSIASMTDPSAFIGSVVLGITSLGLLAVVGMLVVLRPAQMDVGNVASSFKNPPAGSSATEELTEDRRTSMIAEVFQRWPRQEDLRVLRNPPNVTAPKSVLRRARFNSFLKRTMGVLAFGPATATVIIIGWLIIDMLTAFAVDWSVLTGISLIVLTVALTAIVLIARRPAPAMDTDISADDIELNYASMVLASNTGTLGVALEMLQSQASTGQVNESRKAKKWSRTNYVLGIPATILTAVGAVTGFKDFQADQQWLRNILAITTLIGSALAAVVTSMSAGIRSETSRNAAASYQALAREIALTRTVDLSWWKGAKQRESLEEYQRRLNTLSGVKDQSSFYSTMSAAERAASETFFGWSTTGGEGTDPVAGAHRPAASAGQQALVTEVPKNDEKPSNGAGE